MNAAGAGVGEPNRSVDGTRKEILCPQNAENSAMVQCGDADNPFSLEAVGVAFEPHIRRTQPR
jgi:hypothetical protein